MGLAVEEKTKTAELRDEEPRPEIVLLPSEVFFLMTGWFSSEGGEDDES